MATVQQIEELVANMDRSTTPHALTLMHKNGDVSFLFRGSLRDCVMYLLEHDDLFDEGKEVHLEPAPAVS